MPLRALWNGRDVLSCLLSPEEWAALERERRLDPGALILPCCKTAAYQRVGAYGTAHFVHQPGTACDTAPESAEHLRAKADIAHACHTLGWTPLTEFRGRDWVADVLARKGERKVAFEVQMSPQTVRDTKLRHDRYARDGVRDCWLFAKLPAGLEADANLPSFRLLPQGVDTEASVEVGPAVFGLRQFVGLYLSRQVRFSRQLVARTQQKVGIVFFDAQCRGCSETTLLYHVLDPFLSHCGQSVSLGAKPDASAAQQTLPLAFRPEIVEALRDFRRARRTLAARLAEPAHRAVPRSRFSKLTLGCRVCGRPFAWEEYATQLERAIVSGDAQATLRIEAKVALQRSVHEPFPHWCCRPGTGGCAEAAERA